MQFCHGGLGLPARAQVVAACSNGSVEATSVFDGGRPDAVAACRTRRPVRAAQQNPRSAPPTRATLQPEPFAAVLGVLAGATSYQKIITFIAVQRLNTAFSAGFRRAPAVNTLRSLFLALERDDLEAAFRRHAQELNGTVRMTGKRTVALDGKTLRGSFDHLNDRKAAHV